MRSRRAEMRARGRPAESGFPDRELDRGPLPLLRVMLINTGSGVTGEQLRHWRRTFIQDKTNGGESRSAFWVLPSLFFFFLLFHLLPIGILDRPSLSSPRSPARGVFLPLREKQVS